MDFWCDSKGPIVETDKGKIRGYRQDGLYYFRGIKYADADRFEMPRPVEPWEGVKDCTTYGYTSTTVTKPDIIARDILLGFRYWPQSEHCQYLNIWTKDINNDVRRPVMVWIHGGGFSTGSAVEHKCYEAENLCREGDVVVVSINHRLNSIGFMNMAEYGEEYANSGVAGIADIVAALEWVRDNIANFGGDPNNVTVFGQSGGGGKITCLFGSKAADGLYHKAILQSGILPMPSANKYEDSAKVAHAVMNELGLTKSNIKKIRDIPVDVMNAAFLKVAPKLREQGVNVEWSPVPGSYYVGDPYENGFSEYARSVPTIVGSVVAEFPTVSISDKHSLSEEKIMEIAHEMFGEGAREVMDVYRKTYPDKHIADLFYLDYWFRVLVDKYLTIKCEGSDTPNYCYLLTYDFAYNGGLPAWHSSDLMLVFRSAEVVPVYHEPGAMKLQDQMSTSWSNFAKTGDPNSDLIPKWTPYRPADRNTMVFDIECADKCNFDRELMEVANKYGQRPGFRFRQVKQY